jgi:glucan biosynthesis protein C
MNMRRADLDWLRVLAFGLLIFYHAGMAWSGWHWHLNSAEPIGWLREGMRFLNRWRMPLVFAVSGGAVALALGQRTPLAFIGDRLRRLLIPLVFGMLVIVPPQVYAERHYYGQFAGSFLEWLPQAFVGTYPKGNVSWHHLWFLIYVLIQTFVLLPYFLWARSPGGRALQSTIARRLAPFGGQWLMVLPLAASILWLAPISKNPNGLVGDWYGLVYYGTVLLYGGFIFGTPEMLAALNRQRFVSLGVGVVSYAVLDGAFFQSTIVVDVPSGARPEFALLSAVNTLAWIFSAIGFANRHLSRRPAWLGQVTEAVFPVYILHQTVTVIAVYWLLTLKVPPVPGFFIAVIATFAISCALYALVIRRVGWLRPLFGLKGRSLPLAVAAL